MAGFGTPRFWDLAFEAQVRCNLRIGRRWSEPVLGGKKAPGVMALGNRVTAQSPVLLQDRPSNYARKVGAMVSRAGTTIDEWVAMRATT